LKFFNHRPKSKLFNVLDLAGNGQLGLKFGVLGILYSMPQFGKGMTSKRHFIGSNPIVLAIVRAKSFQLPGLYNYSRKNVK
jgi:hypothetical protein